MLRQMLFAVMWAVGPVLALSQEERPKGSGLEIMRAAKLANGGAAIDRAQDTRQTSRIHVKTKDGEFDIQFTVIELLAGKIWYKSICNGSETIEAFDGTDPWEVSNKTSRRMPADRLDETANALYRDWLVLFRHLDDGSFRFDAASASPINGRAVRAVRVTGRGGRFDVTLVFDAHTLRPVRKDYVAASFGPLEPLEERYSDYRIVNGIAVPFRIEFWRKGAQIGLLQLLNAQFGDGSREEIFSDPARG